MWGNLVFNVQPCICQTETDYYCLLVYIDERSDGRDARALEVKPIMALLASLVCHPSLDRFIIPPQYLHDKTWH